MYVVAGVLAVGYVVCVNDKWFPTPDSALYAGLGRSLAEGNGYVFNGVPDNTVTPGLPLVIAAARVLTGGDGWWLCNLFITASGLAALGFIRASLRRLMDGSDRSEPMLAPPQWRSAIASPAPAMLTVDLATLMLAGSFLFFEHAHYLLTDMPFIALAWMALYTALRAMSGHAAWLALTAALSAAAITVRAPMLPFLILLAAGLAFQPLPRRNPSRRRWLAAGVLLAGTLIAAAVWFFWGRSMGSLPYVESASRYASEFFTRATGVAWALSAIMSTLMTGTHDLPWLGAAGWIVSLLGLAMLWRRGQRMGLLVLIPYTIAIAVSRRAGIPDRYFLPVAPFLLLGLAQGAWSLATLVGHLARANPVKATHAATLTLLILTAALILSNSVRTVKLGKQFAYLAHTDRYETQAQRGDLWDRLQEAEQLARILPEDGLFIAERWTGRIVHYFCHRRFVPLPQLSGEPLDAAAADRFWDFWEQNPDVPVAVLPWPKPSPPGKPPNRPEYAARLTERFANQPELYRGRTTIIVGR